MLHAQHYLKFKWKHFSDKYPCSNFISITENYKTVLSVT